MLRITWKIGFSTEVPLEGQLMWIPKARQTKKNLPGIVPDGFVRSVPPNAACLKQR